MPGLVACGHQWSIGSDDLVFPGIAEISVRLAWLIGIAVVFNIHNKTGCNAQVIQIYYIGILVILSCHIVLDLLLSVCSGRGSILRTKPRRSVPYLLYLKLALFIPDIVWNIIGFYWAFGFDGDANDSCKWYIVWTVRGAVIVSWVILLSLIIAILILFLNTRSRSQQTEPELHADAAQDRWLRRCRWACCCVRCDEQSENALKEAATVFSRLFSMDNMNMNLVPTDVAAGLVLMSRKQALQPDREQWQEYKHPTLPSTSEPPPSPAAVQTEVLVNLTEQEPEGPTVTTVDVHWAGGGGDTVTDQSADDKSPTTANQQSPPKTTNQQSILVDLATPITSLQAANAVSALNSNARETADNNVDGSQITDTNIEIVAQESPDDVLVSSGAGTQNNVDTEMTNYPIPKYWMTVPNAAYYMRFALGIYGWPLYLYTNFFTGGCRLIGNCKCCRCCVCEPQAVDDNCCECNLSALKKITGLKDQDIIYVSFVNKVYTSPFYVALDHKNKCVVISIRGSMSLRDVLTDVAACAEDREFEGVGTYKVHKGIYQSAQNVKNELQHEQILEKAFRKVPEYRLMIVGHSLGAGIAALLAIFLKQQYANNVSCFAFSPPGGLISSSLANCTKDFVCSVVTGADLVPRLGIYTMELLKVDILSALRASQLPKYKILVKGCWSFLCCTDDGDEEDDALLNSRSSSPLYTGSSSRDMSDPDHQLQHEIDQVLQSSREAALQCDRLYMPGQVLYFKRKLPTRFGHKDEYIPMWSKPELFDEIIVNGNMLGDHFPDSILEVLELAADKGLVPTGYMTKTQKNDFQEPHEAV